MLLFFDFGTGEIFLIILMVFLVFGPSKIPEIARSLGKTINEVKRASSDIKNELDKEIRKIDREEKLKEYQKLQQQEAVNPNVNEEVPPAEEKDTSANISDNVPLGKRQPRNNI